MAPGPHLKSLLPHTAPLGLIFLCTQYTNSLRCPPNEYKPQNVCFVITSVSFAYLGQNNRKFQLSHKELFLLFLINF